MDLRGFDKTISLGMFNWKRQNCVDLEEVALSR